MNKIIDNLDVLKDFLKWENPGEFYFVQILKRKKDNPAEFQDSKDKNHSASHHAHAVVLNTYQVYSFAELEEFYPRIKEVCDKENARAYISVNKTNVELVCMELAKNCIESRLQTSVKFKQLVDSAIGKTHCGTKFWVIDVDNDSLMQNGETIDHVCDKIFEIFPVGEINSGYRVYVLNTPNGYHVITRGFDTRRLSPLYSVHKMNPTILYANVQKKEV